MKIPRCAPRWLMRIADHLVQAGRENPGQKNLDWAPTWETALIWIHTPAYSVLAYRAEDAFDETMQLQLLDAFSRCCKRNLVSIVNETEISAICFFGGAPLDVELGTLDFAAMDITRQHGV